jgi:hypothetical protein
MVDIYIDINILNNSKKDTFHRNRKKRLQFGKDIDDSNLDIELK